MQRMISNVLRHPRLQMPLRVAAGATWIAVAVQTLTPDSDPRRQWASVEVTLGTFGVAALVTRLAFRHTKSRRQLIAFSMAAALPAVVRHWTPSKSGGAEDWIAGTAAALAGIAIARAIDHMSWRPTRPPP